ncbi:MAG TPA: hypothetical protein ENL04_00185, partial [Sulfuricurvum sp.]|nr:hypothetical protein [Sulfuricurvum sp.]
MKRFRLELKILFYGVIFACFMIAVQGYMYEQTAKRQLVDAIKSKEQLLIDTILPIISLNMAMGLDEANRAYLMEIMRKNSDVLRLEILDSKNLPYFQHERHKGTEQHGISGKHVSEVPIVDTYSHETIGKLKIDFSTENLQRIQRSYNAITGL